MELLQATYLESRLHQIPLAFLKLGDFIAFLKKKTKDLSSQMVGRQSRHRLAPVVVYHI